MDTNPTHYLPIVTTIFAAGFTVTLFKRWQRKPAARYLLWWTIGVAMYGVGTLAESMTTLFGWSEPVFRSWYIAGALLGGAPLATGTVYLLLSKRVADRFAIALVSYVAIISALVLASPINPDLVEPGRLSGQVMEWSWVRLFSPLVNLYAVIFLVGGALRSAWQYSSEKDASSRVIGNVLIAVGAILPGIGGGFARAGVVEVLYVTELLGLTLIWAGFRVISGDSVVSIFNAQRALVAESE
jgi:hypothetical protein